MEDLLSSTHKITTFSEADAHDWRQPAWVHLEGRWIRLVMFLQDRLRQQSPEGGMTRAIECLITGVLERESILIQMGLNHALLAAQSLTQSPVVERGIAAERQPTEHSASRGALPVRPELLLVLASSDPIELGGGTGGVSGSRTTLRLRPGSPRRI